MFTIDLLLICNFDSVLEVIIDHKIDDITNSNNRDTANNCDWLKMYCHRRTLTMRKRNSIIHRQ